jgi:hypothetical protein
VLEVSQDRIVFELMIAAKSEGCGTGLAEAKTGAEAEVCQELTQS